MRAAGSRSSLPPQHVHVWCMGVRVHVHLPRSTPAFWGSQQVPVCSDQRPDLPPHTLSPLSRGMSPILPAHVTPPTSLTHVPGRRRPGHWGDGLRRPSNGKSNVKKTKYTKHSYHQRCCCSSVLIRNHDTDTSSKVTLPVARLRDGCWSWLGVAGQPFPLHSQRQMNCTYGGSWLHL